MHDAANMQARTIARLELQPVQEFNCRDEEGECFPRACDSLDDDVLMAHEEGDCGGLYGGHLGMAHGMDDI